MPAFTGLGAPHWDPDARGAILGLTRDSGVAHIVRAALEAVAYQTADLVDAMVADMRRRDRRGRARHAAGRWRHGGQRLAVPVPGRHAGPAGGTAGGGRDHGPGCGLPRRARRRRLRFARGGVPGLAAGAAVRAGHGGRRPADGCSTAGAAPWPACAAEPFSPCNGRLPLACSQAKRTKRREAGRLAGSEQRRAQIVDLVRRQGFVSIDALAQRFAVTPQTVRRDINALCDAGGAAAASRRCCPGLLGREHRLSRPAGPVHRGEAAHRRNWSPRHIPDHASLFINIGTTTEEIATAPAAPCRPAGDHQQPQRRRTAERQAATSR